MIIIGCFLSLLGAIPIVLAFQWFVEKIAKSGRKKHYITTRTTEEVTHKWPTNNGRGLD